MKKLFLFVGVATLAVSLPCFGVPTDGSIYGTGNGVATSSIERWRDGIVAADGGTMEVGAGYGSPSHWLTFSTAFTLGNLYFLAEGFCSFTGKTLTMSGDAPVIRQHITTDRAQNQASSNRRGSWIGVTIQGTGANTLVKDGGAKFVVNKPIVNFGEVYVKDGGLVATNNGGVAVTDCPLRLSGYLGYQAGHLATGGDWAASGAANGITAEPGAQISINKVNGDSATLTVGPLAKTDHGSLLVRSSRGTTSARSLGSTEKLKTTGTVPTNKVSGLVAPWIAAREVGETGTPVHFLKYDAAAGFLPFSDYLTSFGSSTKDNLVRITAATTVAAETEAVAAAVEVDNANQLTVNGTLKLGDGTNPGAIALNETGTGSQTMSGTGMIDFGDKPGYIWRGSQLSWVNNYMSTPVLYLTTKFSGTQGVTITSGGTADGGSESPDTLYMVAMPVYYLGNDTVKGNDIFRNVTGGIHLANGEFRFYRNSFGANDVYLDGGNRWGSAVLKYWDYGSGSITNHLHVRGNGSLTVDGGKAGAPWQFDAPVTLTGNAGFTTASQAFYFTQPIDGTGDLSLSSSSAMAQSCHIRFDAANTYVGRTTIANNTQVFLNKNGRFGTGDVTANGTVSKVTFNGQTGYQLTQAFTNPGKTELRSAKVDFLGKTANGTTTVTESELGVGADVSLTTAYLRSVPVKPMAAASTLTVGGGSAISATFTDVAGNTLDLVKTGAGTATFGRPLAGASTAKGKLRIDEGTVKFDRNPLNSPGCSLWLDFSDDTKVTTSGDNITQIASKGAVPYVAKYNNPTGASASRELLRTKTINGKKVATVYVPNTTREWYSQNFGEYAVGVRTLFIVLRPDGNPVHPTKSANPGVFGDADNNAGLRVSGTGGARKWETRIGSDTGYTSATVYTNGVLGAGYTPGETQVVAVRVPAGATDFTRFQPKFTHFPGAGMYEGDIGEIIAFDGVLTDEEFDFVNAYLMEKWLGTAHKDVAITASQFLSEETDVAMAADATFDLNGVSQTVASLTGKGKVVNSAGTPVTLTVTDTFDGTISVGAGIDVVYPKATTYRVYNDGPSTNGLAYWLDASKAATILTNAIGEVTNWLSRAGSVAKLLNDGTATYWQTTKLAAPVYAAADTGFGGRPAVKFDRMSDGLWSSGSSLARTIFIVRYDSTATWTSAGNPRIWGVGQNDNRSLFFGAANNGGGAMGIATIHSMAYGQYDDRWRVTKADGIVTPTALTGGLAVGGFVGTPHIVSLRIHEANALWNVQSVTALGAAQNGFNQRWQTVAEVLVYERALPDGEMEAVENYLLNKWITGSGIPAETDTVTLSGTFTIPIGDDGKVTAPITVEGKLDASAADLVVTNSRKGTRGLEQDLVTSEGVTEGFRSTTADWKNFVISLKDGARYVGKRLVNGIAVILK